MEKIPKIRRVIMKHIMKYYAPAPDSEEGWERYSLPIGCSWMGGNVFGGISRERIQITENSLQNPGDLGGLNNFAELYFDFPHDTADGYVRTLDLDRAVATVSYSAGGTGYSREYFMSYPDKCLVIRFRASKQGALNFTVCPEIPFLTDEEGRRKTGAVKAGGSDISIRGTMEAYNVRFAGILRITACDGKTEIKENSIEVINATECVMVFVCATNYVLKPSVFTENDPKKKLEDFDPMPICLERLGAAGGTYDKLLKRHIDDYTNLFGRVSVELGDTDVPEISTDELLSRYSSGEKSHYLEALYFQFGRYLLISSSRPGCLPANLQGVWNCHDRSPWGSGYWHNINVQMNYWPAFVTNLSECFEAYADFSKAFREKASSFARDFIKDSVPENYTGDDTDYGWTIGTTSYPYMITAPGSHSGPGTCGLTTKLFRDYWDFTRDRKVLKEIAFPALMSMAKFLTKVVSDYDGKYLSVFSASPEQIIGAAWSNRVAYYHTVGCAFDQMMIWENGHDLLDLIEALGNETELSDDDKAVIETLKEQMDRYDPVQVGWSGQIKEYREEKFYGEIGEYRHRHISQLIGLYPGTIINSNTPAWTDAAKVSLDLRSDESTGWALAHRLNAWSRTKDGNRAYKLFSNLIGKRTLPNLWDFHPPFQIDGNFGGTSGVAEMLLQSHEGYVAPLPALPEDWSSGSFSGLRARGGFEVSCTWCKECIKELKVKSLKGETLELHYPNIGKSKCSGKYEFITNDSVKVNTVRGLEYIFTDIEPLDKHITVTGLTAEHDGSTVKLNWSAEFPVNIWRSADGSPVYELAAEKVSQNEWEDSSGVFGNSETVTYKITGDTDNQSAPGSLITVNHATKLQKDMYIHKIKQLNHYCGEPKIPEHLG